MRSSKRARGARSARRYRGWVRGCADAYAAAGGLRGLADLASFEELGRAGIVDRARLRRDFEALASSPASSALAGTWSTVAIALAAEAFVRAHRVGFGTTESAPIEA